jgi:hypothetical protein
VRAQKKAWIEHCDGRDFGRERTILAMTINTRIASAEMDHGDGVVVTFSDGTICGYVAEELLILRPYRERIQEPKDREPKGQYNLQMPVTRF